MFMHDVVCMHTYMFIHDVVPIHHCTRFSCLLSHTHTHIPPHIKPSILPPIQPSVLPLPPSPTPPPHHHSRINPTTTLGAFINLESTGPGGFETLIQHKGAWTAEAYARAAPYPRGAMWSQDQLDLHVIPGSTDFVVFGEHLPGVDVAFMLDAAAYHTTQDKVWGWVVEWWSGW